MQSHKHPLSVTLLLLCLFSFCLEIYGLQNDYLPPEYWPKKQILYDLPKVQDTLPKIYHNPQPDDRVLIYGDHEFEEPFLNLSQQAATEIPKPWYHRQYNMLPQVESYYKNQSLGKRIHQEYQSIEEKIEEVLEPYLDKFRKERPPAEKNALRSTLSLVLLMMTYVGLLVSEIYYITQLARFKSTERSTIKLNDISKAWPENEGKVVYIQGYVKYPVQPSVIDEFFGLNIDTPLLKREVLMYQWVQYEDSSLMSLQQSINKKKQYSYRMEWRPEHISSVDFRDPSRENPLSFGLVQNMMITPEKIKVGAFTFTRDFIIENFESELEPLQKLEQYFPLQFIPPQDFRGIWSISEDGNYLERKARIGIDSIGDMKVAFSAIPYLEDERLQISMIGKQIGHTIDSSQFMILRVGKHTVRQLFEGEEDEILKTRRRVRMALTICILLFQYGLLSNHVINISFSIPQLGIGHKLGWLATTGFMTFLGVEAILKKISPSGCQIWKPQVLASASGRIAFASTLAIYIFETKNFLLEKVFTHADQNITAIEWEPQAERYLAQATSDKKLVIWEVENENIKFNVTLPNTVMQIEWSRCTTNNILLLLQNGDIRLLDLVNKNIVTIQVLTDQSPTILRWHPKRDSIAAIGYKSGHISFVDVKTLQTYSLFLNDFEGGEVSTGVADMGWDQGEDHLLVTFNDGSLAMIDFDGFKETTQLRFTYERQAVGANCICWRDDKSGDFITTSRKVGALRLWNVANKEPKQVIKVGSHGIHSIKKLRNDPKLVLIAFLNGAIQVYNLHKRKIEFQTEAGHAETVFDLEFCPFNKDQFASCSYDGTVRIWDSNQMKLLQINDTLRNTPIAKEEKHIIYSISWHPKESKIALVGSLGYLMIYDALKSKCLALIQPGGKTPSFKVDWNQKDPTLLVMGSQNGFTYVINCQDLKELKVVHNIYHLNGIFGVCWSPSIKDEYLAGSIDGTVRLCSTQQAQPLKIFTAHQKRVFNVVYNPQLPNIFASGSDDQTVIVWDKNQDQPLKILKGHSHNVRAITFNPELPWCLISGAWDATIKLWDVRSGSCIYTIADHSADVYGITFHPQRPFVFVSSSRDTTLRFWSIDQLISTLRIQLLLDPASAKFFDSSDHAFQTKGEYRLSSDDSQRLIQRFKNQGFKNQIDQLRQFYCFLNLNDGQEEIFTIIDMLKNVDFQPHPRVDELKVLHCAQLGLALKDQANKLRKASGMQMYNTQFAKKEDRLQEAAKLFLRTGNFRDYCETLFELGQYQRALAFAPAVGIEYWQELAERQAKLLESQGNEEAALAAIIANNCDKAIVLFAQNEDYEDGKLVKALQLTGVFKSVLDTIKSKSQQQDYQQNLLASLEQMKGQELYKLDPQLAEFVQDESEAFFYQGKPLLAAASYLSISDFRQAIVTLVRNNELYLAYYISKIFYPQAQREVSLLLCEKAERFFQVDICMQILNNDIQDQRAIQLIKRRLMNNGLLKQPADQSQINSQFETQAQSYLQHKDYVKAVEYLILANKLEDACLAALEHLRLAYNQELKNSDSSQAWHVAFELCDLLQNVNISQVQQGVRDQVLFYVAYSSLFKAIWFGLYEIMIAVIGQIQEIATKINFQDSGLNSLLQGIETAISSRMQMKAEYSMKDQYREPFTKVEISFNNDKSKALKYKAILNGLTLHMKDSVLFNQPGIYLFQASGQNLQGSKKSAFTHSIIKGSPYTFEDGKTIVSQEEALEWAMCNRFSPLNNGFRINPL